ncbi:hypothetical protein Leryth_003633, partial [Lithospermum erythrorhizon]
VFRWGKSKNKEHAQLTDKHHRPTQAGISSDRNHEDKPADRYSISSGNFSITTLNSIKGDMALGNILMGSIHRTKAPLISA